MEFAIVTLLLFIVLTIYFFIKPFTTKYSPLRRLEAERYFKGSVVDQEERFKERNYTHGLALSRDKGNGKYTFKKQAKMCDTALIYS